MLRSAGRLGQQQLSAGFCSGRLRARCGSAAAIAPRSRERPGPCPCPGPAASSGGVGGVNYLAFLFPT